MQSLLQLETQKIYTISEVTRDIRSLLEDNFPSLWVSGEISNFKPAASGHFYFTLKDEKAQLPAIMFRNSSQFLKFNLDDGLEVIAHGRLTVYEPRGAYQIVVDHLEPKGLGALQLAFEQLKKRLEAEGLFNEKRKKPIPYLPTKIGIVTSSQGAVLHDMLTILTRRFPNIEILVNPVRVQGEGAAEEISGAIDELNRRSDVDVLIVGRGGGSLEDLWAFNEEIVVRAIARSEIPVISAVGHETDYTLADMAADLRAPTPSAAAELAVPEKMELVSSILERRSSLVTALNYFLKNRRENLDYLKKRLKTPRRVLEELGQTLDEFVDRMIRAQKNVFLPQYHLKLAGVKRHLEAISPHSLLKKGYSILFKTGVVRAVRSVQEVQKEEVLTVRLSDGELRVVVR